MSHISYGQQEGSEWYFGSFAGMSFQSEPPTALSNGALNTSEGCSSISNTEGELLFYTDGITIYNRLHNVMLNGTELSGNSSATQSGVIVPVPDKPDIFYVFTVSNLDWSSNMEGFRYSKVNMELDGGKGGVVPGEKNLLLFEPTTERITSVKNYNEFGIWVIGHEWESNRFISFLVTANGIDINNPVYSNVGLIHESPINNGKGYMKASTSGDRIAVAIQMSNIIQVFDFNNVNGQISNPISLPAGDLPYGLEFSKDSRFLYADERYDNHLYQWDLEAGDENAVIDSRKTVGVFGKKLGGALQMAPNGKIYIAHKSQKFLSIVHAPDNEGSACNFEYAAFDLCETCLSKEGLPSFIQSYFNVVWIEHEHQCAYDTIFFSLSDTAWIQSISWNFGDPQSGAADSSELYFPWHIYTEPGSYEVTATITHITDKTITKTIEILPLPDVDLGDDRLICDGDSIVFYSGEGFDSYQWMDDDSHTSSLFTAYQEGEYWVRVTDICGTDYDTVFLGVQELPEIDLGNDTVIMYNTTITLDPGNDFSNYVWQDGSELSEYILDYPGIYWVEVQNDDGCKTSDTIYIEAIPFTIHVPTAFSPNGDGLNDTFQAMASYETEIQFRMSIFNRWGERVFKSKRIEDGWDGTFNNMPCPIGAYIWVIDATSFEENEFFKGESKIRGNLTLLR
ncbi:MAG: T9SS type B sorting domain-containing protein [Chlorobi bacterium]|nr:T9SS type B sorting domain-containing protein [Chlorobiota bacterium]